jgi:hypothetical protein
LAAQAVIIVWYIASFLIIALGLTIKSGKKSAGKESEPSASKVHSLTLPPPLPLSLSPSLPLLLHPLGIPPVTLDPSPPTCRRVSSLNIAQSRRPYLHISRCGEKHALEQGHDEEVELAFAGNLPGHRVRGEELRGGMVGER